MDTLVQVGQILFILSVLVILHELGHYIPAKLFKVRAEKFYLFMDPWFSLFKKKIGETEWGIGWLPLGGYVKLAGMMDESMDKEQMKQPPQPWEFRSKKPWQKLIIMLGGITVNLLLAWFIFTIMYTTVGQKIPSTEKFQQNGLSFGEVGKAAGFKNGDKIVSVDGKTQPRFNRLMLDVIMGEKVVVNRNGKLDTITITDESVRNILKKEGKDFIMPRMTSTEVDSVIKNSHAHKAGLKKGDKIISINGKKIVYFDEFKETLKQHKKDTVLLEVNRNSTTQPIKVYVTDSATIGFVPKLPDTKDYVSVKKMSITEAVPAAVKESYDLFVYNIKQFKLILRPSTEVYKQVKSPIGITRQLPTEWDWEFVFGFMALFSIGLAFMNLLPIPGLDGGHALFTLGEMITGKKMNDKTAGYVQTAGMVLLLTLMALVFGKDIWEWIQDAIAKK